LLLSSLVNQIISDSWLPAVTTLQPMCWTVCTPGVGGVKE
jgi:hypothetical protein